ncbi:HAMP domain-containing histidine kinase [Nocardioides sp. HDW12B]|uniref:ATP-binding protein n=1 Tax=Nocardioides sp. HDW12B TaxID=2714939 RepID=UPI00140DF930|nr:histidine kinase dimerization/phospho-acceptor domain-containing protein [Nocardioides sp. HDW12B]QIK67254.1 HAMP domain-containing histidine kinase [Nocardioides sp. HDW12B]
MRERLVAAFVGSTLAVLVLFGVPRAYQVGELVRDDEQRTVQRATDLAAVVVREEVADGEEVTPALLDEMVSGDEQITYVAADGARVASSGDGPADDPENLTASRELPGGGSVSLERSAATVQDRVSEALLPLVLIVLTLLALSVVTGVLMARRLSRPFQRLAAAARRLGTGEPVVDVPHSAIPEVEAIGAAIRTSAVQLEELRRHERELAVHASHELRTPVTALRLELEDLALWPQTSPEVAAQLHASVAELDRLSTAIGVLLDRSADQRRDAARDVDLDALVAEVAAQWDEAASAVGCRLRHEPDGSGRVHVDPVTLRRLVGRLLETSLASGASTVSLRVRTVGSHHEIEVELHGDGILEAPPDPQAGELAQAVGGRLSALHDGRRGVVVRLAV